MNKIVSIIRILVHPVVLCIWKCGIDEDARGADVNSGVTIRSTAPRKTALYHIIPGTTILRLRFISSIRNATSIITVFPIARTFFINIIINFVNLVII